MAKVSWDELETAYDYVSFGAQFESFAVFDKETGEFYYKSVMAGEQDEGYPDEADVGDDGAGRFVWIPHKHELDLGRELVDDFVRTELSEQWDQVRGIFSGRGAYRRYKDFLAGIGQLQAWYDFEAASTKRALLAWAAEQGIEVVEGEVKDDSSGTAS